MLKWKATDVVLVRYSDTIFLYKFQGKSQDCLEVVPVMDYGKYIPVIILVFKNWSKVKWIYEQAPSWPIQPHMYFV